MPLQGGLAGEAVGALRAAAAVGTWLEETRTDPLGHLSPDPPRLLEQLLGRLQDDPPPVTQIDDLELQRLVGLDPRKRAGSDRIEGELEVAPQPAGRLRISGLVVDDPPSSLPRGPT